MKNFSVLAVLAILTGFASACGSGGNGSAAGGQPGAAPGGQSQPTTCAGAWSAYVAANPAGRTLTYAISTHMNAAGHDTVISTDTETDSVTESSDDHVTRTTANRHGTHSFTLSKSDFTGMCDNAGGSHQPSSGGTVITQNQESIDVAAGHFDCSHVKVKFGDSNGDSESWTDIQGSFLVKSVTTVNTSGAVMTTIKELTQHN